MLRLEQFSYYDHVSLAGGRERPIYACRVIDIRGTRYHVLSRIQDAGLDFTGRTNFIAHHLVATPEEVYQLPTPAMVFRKWAGWMSTWNGEPKLLNSEDWSGLTVLSDLRSLPAKTWATLTGDAVHAYGLLEAKPGTCFCSEDATDDTLLTLLAESTELSEVRDSRRDFRVTAWQWTFTTSFQDQDNPTDFRARFVHRDHPAFGRMAGAGCVSLPAVRVPKWTEEEKLFAQKGWQPAQSVSVRPTAHPPIREGETGVFQAEADGVPYPAYQWYEIELGTRQPKPLKGQTNTRLQVQPHRGVSRYKVEAFNRANGGQRASAEVSIEVRVTLNAGWTGMPNPASPTRRNAGLVRIDEDEDEEALRKRQQNVQKAEETGRKLREKQDRNRTIKWMAVPTVILALFALGLVGWKQGWSVRNKSPGSGTGSPTNQLPAAAVSLPEGPAQTNALKDVQSGTATGAVGIESPPAPTNLAPAVGSSSQVLSSALSITAPPAHASLPDPWEAVTIGVSRGSPTASSASNGVFVVTGSGTPFKGKADHFSFVCIPASSDGEFTAHFAGWGSEPLDATRESRLGIMMRDSQEEGAPFVFLGVSSVCSLWASRQETDAPATETSKSGVPISFKLSRAGNHFKGSCLYSGTTRWSPFGDVRIGSPTFSVGDLKDASSFAAKLKARADGVSSYIRDRLKDSTRWYLEHWQGPKGVSDALQQSVIDDLNAIIGRSSIWDTSRFSKLNIRQETSDLLKRDPHGEDLAWLNRLLLEDAYPLELSRSAQIQKTKYLVGLVVCSGKPDRNVMARFEEVQWNPASNKGAPQARSNSGK